MTNAILKPKELNPEQMRLWKIKNAVEEYQCPGCIVGCNASCYEKDKYSESCKKHSAGTLVSGIGKIFLGMPTGFNRLGVGFGNEIEPKIRIFEKYDEIFYDFFNVPVWKHLTENKHTLVRMISPRINITTVDIFLEDCMDKIKCIEVTKEDIDKMD
jgi:hypothetical protein